MRDMHRPSYYAMIYAHVKQAGIDSGWAVSIHGSLASDLDLVAIAWTDDALETVDFLRAIEEELSGTIWTYKWNGPHPNKAGRITWTMPLETDHYIDMTVVDGRTDLAAARAKAVELAEAAVDLHFYLPCIADQTWLHGTTERLNSHCRAAKETISKWGKK